MACGWYAFKEELLIPESQFAHKIGEIGVVVESLVYLLTYAFMYFTLHHMPGSILEPQARLDSLALCLRFNILWLPYWAF